MLVAFTRPAAVPTTALVLVDDRQRPDDKIERSDDLGGRQGAVSEELGRVEGMGEAGGVAVGSDQQRSHALRTTVRRLPLVS